MWWLAGCATVGVFQPAEVAGAGHGAMELTVSWWHADGSNLPQVDAARRFGVGSQGEVGFSLGSSGLGILPKLQLTPPDSPVVLTWAPALYVFPVFGDEDVTAGLAVQVPLLLGLPLGPHQLVLAPEVHGWSGLSDGQGRFAVGGSAALVLRRGAASVVPGVAITVPLTTSGAGLVEGTWIQAGLSFRLRR